jgi:urea transport system substrate-binding protein
MSCSVRSLALAAALASVIPVIPAVALGDEVKVGVLHSLSGTMSISEITVKNATLLAIDEINAAGGVLGKTIVPVVEDGASEPATFAQKAQKLVQQSQVVTVFGGWTSASRKAMLPVFEKLGSLLWYPVQFEGNECSANIMYSGAQPNQQALPALEWALKKGYKKIYLLGSDYVFPRTANLILKKHITATAGTTLVGEEYMPLGGTSFGGIINKIKSGNPDVIINTLNGDSNVAFFKQFAAAGMTAAKLPVISFSIAEQETVTIGPKLVAGHYAVWNYFQSLVTPGNKKFIAAYRAKYGADAVMSDPMVHGYLDVYAWKAAVEKAKSFDPKAVRKAAPGIELDTALGKAKFDDNGSLYQKVLVGQAQPDAQFMVVWSTEDAVKPEPYDPLSFPGKTCGAPQGK